MTFDRGIYLLVQISSDILWTVSDNECDLWLVMSGCLSVNVVHKWSTLSKYNISFISLSASNTNITLRHTDDTQQCADSMSSMSQLHTSDKSIAGHEDMSRLRLTTHERNDHRGMCDRRRAVGTMSALTYIPHPPTSGILDPPLCLSIAAFIKHTCSCIAGYKYCEKLDAKIVYRPTESLCSLTIGYIAAIVASIGGWVTSQ